MAGSVEVVISTIHTSFAEAYIVGPGAVTTYSTDIRCWGHDVVKYWAFLLCWSRFCAERCFVNAINRTDIEIKFAFSINTVRSLGAFHFRTLTYAAASDASFVVFAVRVSSTIRESIDNALAIITDRSKRTNHFATNWDAFTILADITG